ncbi:hypothetical protein Sste5346_010428 [Sporothrix stenoceras]|uniref:Glycoside hydrolase family 39 protein n=1 Tax=Sporothrix stenoceras TaxID=5173 RepID=A0ABR3YH04_9PEZI
MHCFIAFFGGHFLAFAAAAASYAYGKLTPNHVVQDRDIQGTATINLTVPQGTPEHLASGFIYGIPDTPDQIPDDFYTDMGFPYTRAGVADVWGADGTAQIEMPGDDGNWTNYNLFLDTLFDGMKAGGMINGVDFEIWNEPDLSDLFWQRNQSQCLEMWGRAFPRIQAALPGMPIIGPCSSSQPSTTNSWYAEFYPSVLATGSVPDIYCWHEETSGDDVVVDIENNQASLAYYGLPTTNPTVINEYALPSEQNPGSVAWFISRLERYDRLGLRGNWTSGYALHDYFAQLLGKPGAVEDCTSSSCNITTGYWPNDEYNVYKYYNLNMTGQRVQTVGSPDSLFDIYATTGVNGETPTVKMLCGSRLTSGTWDILVAGLNAVGLPAEGSVTIQSFQFNYVDGRFGDVSAPVNQGTYAYTCSNNELVFYVSPNGTTGYALEFVL